MNFILIPVLAALVIGQGIYIWKSGSQFDSVMDSSYELLDMVKECRENPEKYMN